MIQKKWFGIGLGLTAILAVAVLVYIWFSDYALLGSADELLQPGEVVELQPSLVDQATSTANPSTQPTATPPGNLTAVVPTDPVSFQVESVVTGLTVPWDIVFTGPDRMLVPERTGAVLEVVAGQLQPDPLITFQEVATSGEAGLMGLVKGPDYDQTKYLYACVAYPKDGGLVDKVVRLIDLQDRIDLDQIILDDIPAARFHAGCRLAFGPDSKLYVTTGDATDGPLAQDPNSLAGKILRLNPDGSIPADNPTPGSYVYSLGHRNPQGLDWHPVSGALYATEHGPSVFDGPAGGDEVNHIVAGGNYGWPEVSHQESAPEFVDPLLVFTPAEAPGSGQFYTGNVFPQFTNQFLFGALRGEGIVAVELSSANPDQVLSYQKLDISVGRVRAVTTGPDGLIYFTTSNQDGRGESYPGDDQVYRLVPVADGSGAS